MAKVSLLRKSTSFDPSITSYKMVLEVLSTENIVKSIFVKQRIRNIFNNSFDDNFVAIATPVQLEDFSESSPNQGDSYFRSNQIELIGRTPEYLEWVFETIKNEIQKLVLDVEALNELEADGIYTITADKVDVNMAIQHTHYRLPLIAKPCGISTLLLDNNNIQRLTISNQDSNLSGWLKTGAGDPNGYKFKYNIGKDPALFSLFPPAPDKIDYASLETNGITETDVKIIANGIYWKSDLYGETPWPSDYGDDNQPLGSPENQVTLVLDFIK